MIKVGYSDQLFYLRPKEPRNLRIKIVLKEKLNLDFLKKAVNETLELLPEFKIQVKLIDGEL